MAQRGYLWLFVIGAFFLLRLLIDPAMVRRPLLEPNLSASGLTFACASMLVFLMSNVIIPEKGNAPKANSAAQVPSDRPLPGGPNAEVETILKQRGPGYPLFHVFSSESDDNLKRVTAILAHLAIVLGMVLIGYRHFDNTHTGIAAATLYLLLPYTAEYTPQIDHVVPGAFGLGDSILSSSRHCRNLRRTGGRVDLVSAVSFASVVLLLLAARAGSLQRCSGRCAGAGHCFIGFRAADSG